MSGPIIGIVQARFSSQRLPGKVLLPLVGSKSVLEALLLRLRNSSVPWWVATGELTANDPIAKLSRNMGVEVHRGSEENVLSRFKELVEITGARWVVRVTADNPFTSGEMIDHLVSLTHSVPPGIKRIWGKYPDAGYPLGFMPEIVRADAIVGVSKLHGIENTHHASHVTSFLEPQESMSVGADPRFRRPEWRWTIDTEDDLVMARRAFALFGQNWRSMSYSEMVESLARDANVPRINAAVKQKQLEDG